MDETTTPADQPSGEPPSGPRVNRDQVRDLGRLRRSTTDRHVAGVSGGLGRHLDIDPVIVRVGFVVLALFGGAGLLLYLACWLLVPEEGQERAVLDLDVRTRTVALIGVGAIAALATVGGSFGGWSFPLPLVLIALVAVVVLGRRKSRATTATPEPQPQQDPAATAPAGDASTAPAGDTGYYWTPPTPGASGTPAAAGPAAPLTYAAPAPRPRDPRKRGPLLFWATMAAVALGWGILGIVDAAGTDVPAAGYPALAVTIIGAMLLVGAWFGRAGGLILAGLVATVGLAGATAADHVEGEQRYEAPTTAAQVSEDYWTPAGELVLDLSGVTDLEALDGRTITAGSGAGRLEVILPAGLDVEATGRVGGPGRVEILGVERGGFNSSLTRSIGGGADDNPDLRLDAFVGLGEIVITTK